MKGSSFGYLVREGARSVYANRLMSVAAIGVLAACLMLIGGACLLSLNVNSVVGYMEDQNEVVIFVKDSADEATIQDMETALRAIRNISYVDYISREQGLQEQMELWGSDAVLLEELVDDNPLPNSFRVSVDDLSLLDDTLGKIDAIDGVDFYRAPEDMAQTITGIKQAVYVAGSAVVIILAVVSLIIIANTIKVTVFNRRKEINIMKYVGATDTFIRLPFMVEGIILGLVSALLAFLVVWLSYNNIVGWFGEMASGWMGSMMGQIIPFEDLAWQLFGCFAAVGVLVGALGSMFFVRRYLRV